jgi:hypothetical protein
MTDQKTTEPRSALMGWFQELLRGPVSPTGDYFLRLQDSVEASAPECAHCA